MLSSATYSSAQSLYHNPEWLLPPHQISFTPSGASANASAVSGGNYSVANGAFDEQGNLLFYVKDGSVYNAANGFVGLLLSGLNPEVAIVPKPGTCDQYYLISWETQAFIGTDLVYATVTVSGGAVSLSGTTKLSGGFIHMNGLAVSDPINAEMDRYLYTVSEVGIDQYHINSGGIDFVQVIANQSDFNDFGVGAYAHDTPEAELAGNCIAWGSMIGDPYAFVAIFHPNTFALQDILTLPLPHEDLRVAGIEFANGGNRVYVSTYSLSGEFTEDEGVYFFDADDEFREAKPCQIEGEERYSKTHLEKARDGNIYLVSESGKLSYFHPSQNDISVSPLNITLGAIGSFVPQDLYTLPDQMDDDDYGSFTGYPVATIDGITINAQALPQLPPPGGPPAFFNCQAIDLDANASGGDEYRILAYSTDADGDPDTGPGKWDYIGNWVSNIIFPVDMLNLPGASGTHLQNNANGGQTYAVEVQGRNQCKTIVSEVGQFALETTPTPTSIDLVINRGNGDSSSACPNILNPCLVSATGGSFTLGNSTGTIDYYRIDAIEEVDCNTGQVLATIHTETSNNTNFNQVVSARNFNNITVSSTGQQGYFTANAFEKCYKMTVSIGNTCGETSAHTYLYFIDQFRLANPDLAIEQAPYQSDQLQLSPNPTSGMAMLNLELSEAQALDLQILNANGQVVLHPLVREWAEAGTQRRKLNLAALPPGVYLWRMQMGQEIKTGRLIKL